MRPMPTCGRGTNVQGYDLIMLIVLGMATIFGAIKGFAWQVASLASIIASYIVAYRFRYDVAEMIQAQPPWNQFLAMLILYVGTSFVIWVGFRLLSGTIDRMRLKEFDRHLGAAFGLIKGVVYCLLITMFATSLLGPKQQAAICHSRSGYYIAKALDQSIGVLPQEIHDVVGPYLSRLDDKLKSGGALDGNQGVEVETRDSLWPAGGIPGLDSLGQSLQQGIRDALPNVLPGTTGTGVPGGPGATGSGSGQTGFSDGWNDPAAFNPAGLRLPGSGLSGTGLPGTGLPGTGQPGSLLPPSNPTGNYLPPQSYPPLGQNSLAPWPSSAAGQPPVSPGLRPTTSASGSSSVLPR